MASAAEAGGGSARYRRLKPGPGHSSEDVAADQRDRIHRAMVELVAERGYEAIKVSDLVGRARVSTRTFYERCQGKQECLLETYDEIMARAARRIAASQGGERDQQRRSRLALGALAKALAERPEAARLVCLDASAAGLAALKRMRAAEATFAEMVGRILRLEPAGAAPSPILTEGVVAGLTQVVRARLISKRQDELPDLVDDLLGWAFSLRAPGATELEELGGAAGDPRAAASALAVGVPVAAEVSQEARERELILAATIEIAMRDGFLGLSVPRIRAAAGVSRKSFEAHYVDVEECFVAALDLVTQRLMDFIQDQSLARGRDWPAGFHSAVASLCAHAASNPGLARLAMIEVFASGPLGLRHLSTLVGTTAERSRADAPAGQQPTPAVAEASMGAVWGIVHHCVAREQPKRLRKLAPLLSFLALSPPIGAEAAIAAIRAEEGAARV
jgi:AcrR family transcriptional regulator